LPHPVDVNAVLTHSSLIANTAAVTGNTFDFIPLSTGSVAEFYIEPMLSCVGDVDIMFHFCSQLVIPQGHPPPTQLPDEFHGRVLVCEIINSEFPGYVYLVSSYLLTEITDDGKYNAMQFPRLYVFHVLAREQDEILGPAVVRKNSLQILSHVEPWVNAVIRHGTMYSLSVMASTSC